MCLEDTVRIPLHAKDGSIRAYALIDAADATIIDGRSWSLAVNGYVVSNTRRDGTRGGAYLHRDILNLVTGDGLRGDHINRDKLDNRRSNLRPVTRRGNAQNVSSRKGSSSVHRGVHWDRCTSKWVAQVHANGKSRSLGYFADEMEAAAVAREARLKLLPFAVD